jgi:hypothetical protein
LPLRLPTIFLANGKKCLLIGNEPFVFRTILNKRGEVLWNQKTHCFFAPVKNKRH